MKKRTATIILVSLIIAFIFAGNPKELVTSATNWYVSPAGTGDCTIGNECSLWDAVDAASNGDTIYLRYGPYVAQSATDDEVLYFWKSLTIIGGCDATFTTCELGFQYTGSYIDGDDHLGNPRTRAITIQGNAKYRPTVTLRNLHIVRGNGYGIANDVACANLGTGAVGGCGGGIYADQLL